MDLRWNVEYQQEWVEFRNCNNCKWLKPTEEEQRMTKPIVPHFCYKYYKRIFHRINNPNPDHDSFLWPCKACFIDGCKHYIERGETMSEETTVAPINQGYELRKLVPFLARCIYKQEVKEGLDVDELRALENIIDDLGGWDIDPKEFHW